MLWDGTLQTVPGVLKNLMSSYLGFLKSFGLEDESATIFGK
jgi:hypothetical protein